MIRLSRGDFGTYVVESLAADGTVAADILVQTDYDFPGLAGTFGWSVRSVAVQPFGLPPIRCEHEETDGTVPCYCGAMPSDFISSAAEYLDSHIGATADDPGYFAAD